MARTMLVALTLLLAGCTGLPGDDASLEQTDLGGPDDTSHPAPGQGLAPQEGHDQDSDSEAPGLGLHGDLTACDGGFCIDATASNDGPGTYHVSDICITPWRESMKEQEKSVQHREPMAHCEAFGTTTFAPGDALHYEAKWDGRLWNDTAGEYEDAPEGSAYQWSVHFRAYEEAEGGAHHDLEVTFTVVIGET